MMDGDDDIAASLPRPPLPAPARREAAIEEALRRFDGGGERPRGPAAARRAARPAPWRAVLDRPWAGALAAACLVALIGLPMAWISLGDRLTPHARAPGTVVERAAPSNSTNAAAMADASQPAPVTGPAPARVASNAPPPGATSAVKAASPAAAPAEIAPAAPSPPPPPAPAPPPPPPPAEAFAKADDAVAGVPAPQAQARISEPPALGGSNLASRTGRPAPAPSAASADEGAEAAIAVTGTRIRARSAGRGDWNACTVDDPGRSLDRCRKLVDPARKGPAGEVEARVADGLSRAWEGDFEGAIRAFDQAIAAAPHSSFAYLNRGLAYRRSGDLGRALADLDRAVRYAPGEARSYYNRSLVLRQRGDLRRARADAERAADLDPRYADPAE
jgi:tetratricopeptide (TPR) repeat protein